MRYLAKCDSSKITPPAVYGRLKVRTMYNTSLPKVLRRAKVTRQLVNLSERVQVQNNLTK